MIRRFWWIFPVMAVSGAVAGLLIAGVITFLMPKTYESKASVEVKPLLSESPAGGNEIVGSDKHHETPPYLMGSLELIKSDPMLGAVVEKLELERKLAVDRPTAMERLRKQVTVLQIRGTDLVSIAVRDTDKERARDIAEEVISRLREYRSALGERDREKAMQAHGLKLKDLEERVEERTKVLNSIALNGIPKEPLKRSLGGNPDYEDAKKDLDQEIERLRLAKLERVAMEMSYRVQDGSVVLHEDPQIGQTPVSPKVSLNLLLGLGGGLLLSPVLASGVLHLLGKRRNLAAGSAI